MKSPIDDYTYMFSWQSPLWMCTKAYVPLGEYLKTDGWADITNNEPPLIRTITFRRDSVNGPEINEEIATEISAAFEMPDPQVDDPLVDSPAKKRKLFGSISASAAASSSSSAVSQPGTVQRNRGKSRSGQKRERSLRPSLTSPFENDVPLPNWIAADHPAPQSLSRWFYIYEVRQPGSLDQDLGQLGNKYFLCYASRGEGHANNDNTARRLSLLARSELQEIGQRTCNMRYRAWYPNGPCVSPHCCLSRPGYDWDRNRAWKLHVRSPAHCYALMECLLKHGYVNCTKQKDWKMLLRCYGYSGTCAKPFPPLC